MNMNMSIAEKVKKQFNGDVLVNKDFSVFGGRIVESSDWSRKYIVSSWKIWRFSDRSNLLVSTKGVQTF